MSKYYIFPCSSIEKTKFLPQWFRAPTGFAGHVANAFEDENGHIMLQMAYSKDNVFFWWPDKDGKAPRPGEAECKFVCWDIDYHSSNLDLTSADIIIEEDMEFPRIDDRFATTQHHKTLFNVMDKQAGTDMRVIGPVLGGEFSLFHLVFGQPMCQPEAKRNRRPPFVQRNWLLRLNDKAVSEILRWTSQALPRASLHPA